MRRRHRFGAAIVAGAVMVLSSLLTQSALAQKADAKANRPIPRLSDGHISFEAPPGETGVWNPGDSRPLVPEKPEEIVWRERPIEDPFGRDFRTDDPTGLKPRSSEVPFQPWARALFLFRQIHEFEPYTRCKPSGGFRQVGTTYGTEFVQQPEQQRMYIFQTGGPHTFRPIYLDGRAHPTDLDPSYYGHSLGHWEGDTLVVDTVNFNERGWIDAYGSPTTKQLHLVERFTRLDFRRMRYQITIDDPGAYTAPWTTGMIMTYQTDREQFEYICQDGNLASELMIGSGNKKVDRTSPIVP